MKNPKFRKKTLIAVSDVVKTITPKGAKSITGSLLLAKSVL
jgi:hypothetical protein